VKRNRSGEQLVHGRSSGHRLLWIQLQQFVVHRRDQRERILFSAKNNGHFRKHQLSMRPVDGRLSRHVQSHLPDIANHADDFRRRVLAFLETLHVDDCLLAERVRAVERLVHKGLVDDDHVPRFGQLLFIKIAARTQRNLHRREIARPDNAHRRYRKVHQ
jgi:hypothetical protein